MQDYVDDLKRNYRDINSRIRSLQNKLKSTRDSMGQRRVVDELGKLEQEKLQMTNLFSGEQAAEVEQEEADQEDAPILRGLWSKYSALAEELRGQFRDVRALAIYMQHFEDEFLGMLNERKLRLDVKYSVERNTFYNLFSQLQRKLDAYVEEANRVESGEYAKQYEEDILRRLVEMRNGLFIDADKFFGQVNRFAGELLDDIEGEGILCQNGDDKLAYSDLDRETLLRGLTVHGGLERLYETTEEILSYLDVPDFH